MGQSFLSLRKSKNLNVKFYDPLLFSDVQYRYMEMCVDRINEELLWKKPDGSDGLSSAATPKATPTTAVQPTKKGKSKDVLKVDTITNDDL